MFRDSLLAKDHWLNSLTISSALRLDSIRDFPKTNTFVSSANNLISLSGLALAMSLCQMSNVHL